MINTISLAAAADYAASLFKKRKAACPLSLTAKMNNHFGIYNRDKKKETAGVDLHGNFSFSIASVLLFGTLFTIVLSFLCVMKKFSFRIRFKKR